MKLKSFTCFILFLGLNLTAYSQENPYEDVLYNGRFSLNQNSAKHMGMLYRLRGLEDNNSHFFYTTLDTALQQQTTDIYLYKRNRALASAGNTNYSAHLFQRVGYDSVKVLILDRTGKIISRQDLYRSHGEPKLTGLQNADNDSTFLLVYETKKPRGFLLEKINAKQQVLWQQTLEPKEGAHGLQIYINANNIWAICEKNATYSKALYTIFCLDGKTGAVSGNSLLNLPTDRREIGAIGFGPSGELAVNGRWSGNKNKIKKNRPGQFFFSTFSTQGTRLTDAIGNPMKNPAATVFQDTKIHWEKLQYTPDGRWHVIGESFTSTPWAANFFTQFGIAMVTFGMVNASFTTLYTKDLVHVTLSPEGQLESIKAHPLPRTSYTWPAWIPAYRYARFVNSFGVFRYRGHFADPMAVVVKTKDEVHIVNAETGEKQLITYINKEDNEDVFGVLGRKLLIFSGTRKDVGVRQVPIPAQYLKETTKAN